MNRAFQLTMRIPADWDRIEDVRQAVSKCVLAAFGDVRFCDALGMVVSELLENAVKYGVADEPVHLAVEQTGGQVVVTVTNSVGRESRYLKTLVDHVHWIRSFDEPLMAYEAALTRAYETEAEGGLGIVRAAYEGGCSIDCDVETPGLVRVVARCDAPDGPTAGAQ